MVRECAGGVKRSLRKKEVATGVVALGGRPEANCSGAVGGPFEIGFGCVKQWQTHGIGFSSILRLQPEDEELRVRSVFLFHCL